MFEHDLCWMIGGPQGGGINVSAEAFMKAVVRRGIRIFANIEYHSNIMGEHSYYRVRLASEDRHSLLDRINVLVALDDETLFGGTHGEFMAHRGHLHEMVPGGIVIHDATLKFPPEKVGRNDLVLMPVPYMEILKETLREFGKEDQAKHLRVMANVIAIAASLAALDFDVDLFSTVIRQGFKGRRAELAEINARAARKAAEYVWSTFGRDFPFSVRPLLPDTAPARPAMMMRAVHACAVGKIKAGIQLQTYYPISPATDESVYLESHQRDSNLVVVQVEDEVSAINMAVGAAHAGVRVATSTSGPGLSLMCEGFGFASLTEAPGPVVYLWQRGGPSTGLPTRQEQGDLRLALQPGHGDMSHMVVAPGDVQEVFEDSYEAFNWAERYQLPVIVMLDKYQATAYQSVDDIEASHLTIDRGFYHSPTADGYADGYPSEHSYFRYAITESGISPRTYPGQEGGIFWTTTDEHDIRGHITEEAQNRIDMVDKRMRKLDVASREIPAERKLRLYGPAEAELTLVSWGSAKGAVLDAMAEVAACDGLAVNFLQIRLMRPFPIDEVKTIFGRATRVMTVDVNYSGQLATLIREQTGITVPQRIVKYDGRPFSQEELVEAIRTALANPDQECIHVSHLAA